MMTSICIGAVTVGGGFILYKVLPEVYDKLKEILGNFFYKTVVFTLAQNRIKTINLLKFMASFSDKMSRCVSITVDDTQEYEIPVNGIKYFDNQVVISLKANFDNIGNIVNVVVSTFKRKYLVIMDIEKLQSLDKFLTEFPNVKTPIIDTIPEATTPIHYCK